MLFLIFLPRDWALCGQCCKFQPCKLKVFEVGMPEAAILFSDSQLQRCGLRF